MTMRVSQHAIERYRARYRPQADIGTAASELTTLASRAVPAGRTMPDDADLYMARRDDEVDIPLAVRDETVVSVLPPFDGAFLRARASRGLSAIPSAFKHLCKFQGTPR